MDRYQIITSRDKPLAYRFKFSTNAATVYNYMVKCIEDQVLFEAHNISENILEEASVRISKNYSIPIITTTKRMTLMRIAHSYREIYTADMLPSKYRNVMCLWDVSTKKEWKAILRIIRNPIDRA